MLPAQVAVKARTPLAELSAMTLQRTLLVFLALSAISGFAGCASGGRDTPSTAQATGRVALNAAQTQAIEGGVRQMAERQDGVRVSAVTATRQTGKPGLQVCGYVATPDATGKRGKDLPFYIELLDTDGKPVAERGQVGSDPSRLSKVNFMCRHNR